MRGKLPSSIASSILYRITPADAGKTQCWDSAATARWDHPRGCGENMAELCRELHNWGSPPRMRGKPHRPKERGGTPGITPADAGKTAAITIFAAVLWDHPRGCGENLSALFLMTACTGSPPRMRGKLSCGISGGSGAGITPADAGKTTVYRAT